MSRFEHALGVKAKDVITGVEGIIVARAEHLTGCNTYGVAPQRLKDGKRLDTEWFDEGRIRVTGKGVTPDMVKAKDNGSDYNSDNPR